MNSVEQKIIEEMDEGFAATLAGLVDQNPLKMMEAPYSAGVLRFAIWLALRNGATPAIVTEMAEAVDKDVDTLSEIVAKALRTSVELRLSSKDCGSAH